MDRRRPDTVLHVVTSRVAAGLAVVVLGGLAAGPAAAQAQPAAAAPTRPPRPPLEPVPAGMFRLAGVQFDGATVYQGDVLFGLVADWLRRPVGLAELERLADRVTQHYRRDGWFLAQAVVPPQTVRDGVAQITVIEGRIGKVRLSLDEVAPISEARVRAVLARLVPGQPLHADTYERALLLLSDLPGLRVQAGLEAGSEPGTTDVLVEVMAARRWNAAVDLDNYGAQATGRERLGATLRWASPLAVGDNLDARLMTSRGGGLRHGRLAYELPVSPQGARLGAGLGRVSYSLGGDFEVLDAIGTANVIDLSLGAPVLRGRARNLLVRASLEHKSLVDEIRAVGLRTEKTIDDLLLAAMWELRDGAFGGGWNGASLTLSFGRLAIDTPAAAALDEGPGGRRTAGGYFKLAFQASRLQRIAARHTVYAALAGQWAGRNLDASEKFALGGPRAVRAYPGSEVLADEGLLASGEWRYSALDELVLSLFFDAARGRLNHDPLPGETGNLRSLRGGGVGLSWSRPGDFAAQASLAWRTTAAALSEGRDRDPRLFVQLQKSF